MNRLQQYQVPKDIALDFTAVFDFGQAMRRSAQQDSEASATSQDARSRDVPGLFLNEPGSELSGNRSGERRIIKLIEAISKVCTYVFQDGSLRSDGGLESIAFLELSLFDPDNREGSVFYTILCGPSKISVDEYRSEMKKNLRSGSRSRGQLIPNPNLYDSAFYFYPFEQIVDCEVLRDGARIYFGVYAKSDDAEISNENPEDLHSQLEEFFLAVRDSCIVPQRGLGSCDCAILVPLLRPKMYSQTNEGATSLGGGLFVYGKTGPNFDTKDFAIVIGHVLTRGLLDMSIPLSEGDAIAQRAANAWAHEIKGVARALQTKWAPRAIECRDLLQVEIVPKESLQGYIGTLRTSEEWKKNIGLIPYYPFVGTLSAMMSLWCMLDKSEDSPIGRPSSIPAIIQEVWRFTARVLGVFVLRNSSLSSCEELQCTIQQAVDIEDLFVGTLRLTSSDAVSSWTVRWTNENLSRNLSYVRILLALLINSAKHGDPSRGLEISTEFDSREGTPRLITRITNYSWTDGTTVLKELRSGNRLPPGVLQHLGPRLAELVDLVAKGRVSLSRVAGFSSREVVSNVMQNLGWRITGDLFEADRETLSNWPKDRPFSTQLDSVLSEG